MSREKIAADVLECALSHEPTSRLLGNVTAREIAALAASCITSCPLCGAEPWVNIDCRLCTVCWPLEPDHAD
jgi:hypothetical protein